MYHFLSNIFCNSRVPLHWASIDPERKYKALTYQSEQALKTAVSFFAYHSEWQVFKRQHCIERTKFMIRDHPGTHFDGWWWWMSIFRSLGGGSTQHSFLSHDPWPRINTTFRRPLFVLLTRPSCRNVRSPITFDIFVAARREQNKLKKKYSRKSSHDWLIILHILTVHTKNINWTITKHKYQSSTLQPKHQKISIRYVAYLHTPWMLTKRLSETICKTYRENDSMHHSLTLSLTYSPSINQSILLTRNIQSNTPIQCPDSKITIALIHVCSM